MDANELLEPFEKMLEGIATPAQVRAIEAGGDYTPAWDELEASGFLDALRPESQGGVGLSLAEVGPLLQALGRHAVPLPVAETMVARYLLAEAGEVPSGPIALVSGSIVRFGRVAAHFLAEQDDRLALFPADAVVREELGVRAELSARVTLPAQVQGLAVARPEGGLRPVAAVLLAADIAGTAARLLAMTVAYANERVQFGKPIGRQQAIQQQLAVMAEDAVASRMGAELACAGGLPVRVEVAATAKSVASAAAARMANTAHAVHGAIGISEEFDLQLFTRRLQAARRAAGSESYWNGLLGAARLADAEGTVDWVRRRIFA